MRPEGGRAQTSDYGIGCRFNLSALAARLEYFGHLYDVKRIVDVWRADWKTTPHGVASHYKTLPVATGYLPALNNSTWPSPSPS